jgi:hypothetical protein
VALHFFTPSAAVGHSLSALTGLSERRCATQFAPRGKSRNACLEHSVRAGERALRYIFPDAPPKARRLHPVFQPLRLRKGRILAPPGGRAAIEMSKMKTCPCKLMKKMGVRSSGF